MKSKNRTEIIDFHDDDKDFKNHMVDILNQFPESVKRLQDSISNINLNHIMISLAASNSDGIKFVIRSESFETKMA